MTQSPAPQIEDTPVPVKEVSKPKPSRQESDNLPPKPTEKWSYIEELENKEVTVEAVDKTGSTHRYLMQCGAYKSKDQAEQRKAMIAFQGLNSQVKASTGTKGTWYRIILGPYPQKRKAEQDRHTLQRAKITPCAIWYWEWD
ncbi:SPOR domain-containing protein [Vibrio sp. SS-MA-C1-2]|uniref:SPOR domain-containing protein n=1 Tax=Vibrio sp. SS-MA-C1-2 TaxID=2908646 RepID=UPI001F36814C|nr:SPOR domain-containing protein [Vibrio sp. SS-MA-C1-2]UJF19242.1 SPOR domain-containing protein [Vibrio sp. SS-MA-C1-2]